MSKKSIHDKIKVDMVEGLITEKGEFIPLEQFLKEDDEWFEKNKIKVL